MGLYSAMLPLGSHIWVRGLQGSWSEIIFNHWCRKSERSWHKASQWSVVIQRKPGLVKGIVFMSVCRWQKLPLCFQSLCSLYFNVSVAPLPLSDGNHFWFLPNRIAEQLIRFAIAYLNAVDTYKTISLSDYNPHTIYSYTHHFKKNLKIASVAPSICVIGITITKTQEYYIFRNIRH